MAYLLSDAPAALVSEALPHKLWTREELALVEKTGVFESTHYELIEGELIDKMGKRRPQTRTTKRIAAALAGIFGHQRVETESPIDVAAADNPRNEPEPDVIVLQPGAE